MPSCNGRRMTGNGGKTLHAALKNQVPEEAYKNSGIDPTRRGETLTCDEFIALYRACKNCKL